ncbi:MAG: CBS domain-containing protein [Candidatus Anstonellales archaeon]
MTLNKLIKRDVLYVDINSEVGEVAKKMKEKRSGYAIVVDKNRAEGIVTRTDLVYRVLAEQKPYSTKIREVMSYPLIVLFPEMTIDDAINAFNQHPIQRIVIVDKNTSELIGVIDKDDVFKMLSNK